MAIVFDAPTYDKLSIGLNAWVCVIGLATLGKVLAGSRTPFAITITLCTAGYGLCQVVQIFSISIINLACDSYTESNAARYDFLA